MEGACCLVGMRTQVQSSELTWKEGQKAWWHVPVTPVLGEERQWMWGALWPADMANLVDSSPMRDLVFFKKNQKLRRTVSEKDA